MNITKFKLCYKNIPVETPWKRLFCVLGFQAWLSLKNNNETMCCLETDFEGTNIMKRVTFAKIRVIQTHSQNVGMVEEMKTSVKHMRMRSE